ncbi:uncharacterized protein LOC34621023 [Cyclospora cayetanensis]|uniref:Uncharacterized protein n=2 Tax=Cyclospora cayetanensis TaxID=88456 RepID=A0A1D3D2P3_9EIME|nr:uncharacterized protein LOC34621023 [Cyclospora cayetanensis]OEH77719.1 hypothetical protein cyc_04497 [Cyclospora cayetanensis]
MDGSDEQAAPKAGIAGSNQRRLLLEVLRANLRVRSSSAVGKAFSQTAPLNQHTAHQAAAFMPRLDGLAPTMAAAEHITAMRAAVHHQHGVTRIEQERALDAVSIARESASRQARAATRSHPAPESVCSTNLAKTDCGERCKAARDSASSSSYNKPAPEVGFQRGLSTALFAKLAETLSVEKGPLNFLTWEDGSWYCGQLTGGALDGVGVYRYTDGSVYCGQWAQDRLHGYGVFIAPNGFLYRGHFEGDRQNGPGSPLAFSHRLDLLARPFLSSGGCQSVEQVVGSQTLLALCLCAVACAGVFVFPQGTTFFGHFRNGRLHGLSCYVSPSGKSRVLLGEWRDGEFQRTLPLQCRDAEFYRRAAETVDLLQAAWTPLPIPMPDARTLELPIREERTAAWSGRAEQACGSAVLEALRTELPSSLLQIAAEAAAEDAVQAPLRQAERRSSGSPAAGASKPPVRKRKASVSRLQCTQAGEPTARCRANKAANAEASGSSGGASAPPQRATTTKAQLLRWESEARKLPRIPHLNYNRVLGRWYARVRDPASGRRIWKGYTCAVHGFFQARDMAIDRLRQFSQLVSSQANEELDASEPAEDLHLSAACATEVEQLVIQLRGGEDERSAEPPKAEVAPNECSSSIAGTLSSEETHVSEGAPPARLIVEGDASACAPDAPAAVDPRASAEGSAGPKVLSEKAESACGAANTLLAAGLSVGEKTAVQTQRKTTSSGNAEVAPTATPHSVIPLSWENSLKEHLCAAGSTAELSFSSDCLGATYFKPNTARAQDEESLSCSRLTTADCSDTALSRCIPS